MIFHQNERFPDAEIFKHNFLPYGMRKMLLDSRMRNFFVENLKRDGSF